MASNPQNRVVLEDGQFNIANKISGAYQVGSNISGSGSAGLRFTDDVAGNSVSVADGCSVVRNWEFLSLGDMELSCLTNSKTPELQVAKAT